MQSISELELDSIREFINIGMGKAGKVLNAMLESHIDLSIAEIAILSEDEIYTFMESDNNEKLSIIEMGFSGEITGTTSLLFPTSCALNLVQALTGDELKDDDLDAIRVGTLSEIGNIVINALMGMISNILKMRLRYTVPKHSEKSMEGIYKSAITESPEENVLIKISTNFNIKNLSIEGNIIIFLSLRAFSKLKKLIALYIEDIQ
jgi:chemotaxis protein CheC